MIRNFTTSPALSGAILMCLAGTAFALVNLAVQGATLVRGVPAPAVVFWQYAVALILCLPLADLRGAFRQGDWRWHAVRVALSVGGVQLWAMGLAHVPIWQAISLLLLSPVFATLGARLWLGERVGPHRAGALCLGALGGAVVLAPWTEAFSAAALLPVGAAALWAAASLVLKKRAGAESAGGLTLWLFALLLPLNVALAAPSGFGIGPAAGLVVLAGIGTAAAHYALALAYRVADAAYLQPFDHLKLPVNLGLGWIAFGFAPEGWVWGGVAMILGAGLWLGLAEGRRGLPGRA